MLACLVAIVMAAGSGGTVMTQAEMPGSSRLGGADVPQPVPRSVGSQSVEAGDETIPMSPMWHDNLADGWRASKATGLPMLIFISSESCVYCDAMERDTWRDTRIRSQLAGRFVPIHLKKGRNDDVLSRVKIKMYPTTLMANAAGKVTDYRAGYQPPNQILNLVRRPQLNRLVRPSPPRGRHPLH